MDGASTVSGTRSAPHPQRLFAQEPNRGQGQLSLVDVSELPGHWFSDKSPPFREKNLFSGGDKPRKKRAACSQPFPQTSASI